MKWFRLYHEVLSDPKVQLLDAETFRHWINLLCLANTGKPRGLLPRVHDIAFHLRIGLEEANRLLDDFVARELLDATGDGYRPHNWDKRQFKSDDIGQRVAGWRADGGNVAEPAGETPPETAAQHRGNVASNDLVTLHATPPDTDPEAETDPETEQRRSQSGRGITRPPTPARATSAPVPLPSLDDLCAVTAEWTALHGVAPEAVREDLAQYRNARIAEHDGEPPPRRLVAWQADALKWLGNKDFGPKARRAARARDAPREPSGRQPPRTEANLAAIVRTRGAG